MPRKDASRMQSRKVDEALMTPHELARLVGYSPRSLEEWRRRGHGPEFIRLSGYKGVRYPASAVRRWLNGALATNGKGLAIER